MQHHELSIVNIRTTSRYIFISNKNIHEPNFSGSNVYTKGAYRSSTIFWKRWISNVNTEYCSECISLEYIYEAMDTINKTLRWVEISFSRIKSNIDMSCIRAFNPQSGYLSYLPLWFIIPLESYQKKL